jgi:hypothetical protein
MLNLLKTIAVQDQSVTSNIATLDNIMSGVDGSATFGYSLEAQSVQVNDNQKQQYAHTHTLDIRVLQGTAGEVGILDAVVGNNRQVKITGISPDGFLIWDDPSYLVRSSQFDQVVADQILVTKTQPAGYAGSAPNSKLAVYSGDNALALYNVLAGSASVLNGFSVTGTMTASVSGRAQTLTRGADATAELVSAPFFYPFSDVLTLSIFVNSANAGYSIGFRWLDSALAEVATSISGETGATSRKSYSATPASGTVYAQVVIYPGTTATNNLVFQEPALRLNGNSTFTI